MDGIVDQHSGRKIMFFCPPQRFQKTSSFASFIKHVLKTWCWKNGRNISSPLPTAGPKFSCILGQAFSPGCFISQPFLFAPNWFRVPKKKQSWETACQWTKWPSYSTADFPKSWKWSPMPWRPISKKLLERPWQWDSYVVQGHIQNTSWPRTTKLVISKKQSTLCIYTYIYIIVICC